MKRHRPLRLDPAAYSAPGTIAHVNCATKMRAHLFLRDDIANMTKRILRERASLHDVPVYAYCLMPDHAHFLIGASKTRAIDRFVAEVKGLTARESWSLGIARTMWQESFHDDIERASPFSLWNRVRYVYQNPVEDGLVPRWQDWPHSGSTVFSLEQVEVIFRAPEYFPGAPGDAPEPRPR